MQKIFIIIKLVKEKYMKIMTSQFCLSLQDIFLQLKYYYYDSYNCM